MLAPKLNWVSTCKQGQSESEAFLATYHTLLVTTHSVFDFQHEIHVIPWKLDVQNGM